MGDIKDVGVGILHVDIVTLIKQLCRWGASVAYFGARGRYKSCMFSGASLMDDG